MQLLRNLSKAQDWSEKVRDAALDVVQGVENGVKKFEFRVRGQPFVLEVQQARYYTQVGNRIVRFLCDYLSVGILAKINGREREYEPVCVL
jgi:hypothetical protein